MRQRAAAASGAVPPPRSAGSLPNNESSGDYQQHHRQAAHHHQSQWQQQLPQQRQEASLGNLIQDPHPVTVHDAYHPNHEEVALNTSEVITASSAAPMFGQPARRRRKSRGPDGISAPSSGQSYHKDENRGHSSPHGNSPENASATSESSSYYTNHHYEEYQLQMPYSQRNLHHRGGKRHTSSPQHAHHKFHANKFHMDYIPPAQSNTLAAVHFRKALHVPDNEYRAFISGKGRDSTPVCHPVCCANCCAGFSFVALLCMVLFAVMLDTQPLMIKGTLPTAIKETDGGKRTTMFLMTAERLNMASHAYQAAYAYLFTMVACLVYVHYEGVQSYLKRRKYKYQDVPDAAAAANAPGSVVGDPGLPTFHPHHDETPAYQISPLNRMLGAAARTTVKVREWAAGVSQNQKARKKNFAKTI